MQKILIIVLVILVPVLLCACGAKGQSGPQSSAAPETTMSVGFENALTSDARVWILARTKENLSTSLWGTPSARPEAGASCRVPLCDPGDDGQYIFRMIDADEMYYAVDALVLKDGWSLKILEALDGEVRVDRLEVRDASGELLETLDVFAAML